MDAGPIAVAIRTSIEQYLLNGDLSEMTEAAEVFSNSPELNALTHMVATFAAGQPREVLLSYLQGLTVVALHLGMLSSRALDGNQTAILTPTEGEPE
jgi:hypothetical protein